MIPSQIDICGERPSAARIEFDVRLDGSQNYRKETFRGKTEWTLAGVNALHLYGLQKAVFDLRQPARSPYSERERVSPHEIVFEPHLYSRRFSVSFIRFRFVFNCGCKQRPNRLAQINCMILLLYHNFSKNQLKSKLKFCSFYDKRHESYFPFVSVCFVCMILMFISKYKMMSD